LKYRVPPLWPTYIGERRTTFAKAFGITVRCYGEHVGEHTKNLMGIQGNLKGTCWEPGDPKHPPPPKLKREKARHLECMLGHYQWLHEISLPKRVGHHFWLGLLPLPKNTLPTIQPL